MTEVELVIKIPEEQYNMILLSDKTAMAECVSKEAMMYAIKNSTPLSEVLESIKGEIEARLCDTVSEYTDGYRTAIQGVLNILDKYISGKEQK